MAGATERRRLLPSSVDELLSAEPSAFAVENRLLLRGVVVRRKVLSRSLAFCTLKLEAHAEVEGPWQLEPPSPHRLRLGDPAQSEIVGDHQADTRATPQPPECMDLCFTVGVLDATGASAAEEEEAWGGGEENSCAGPLADLGGSWAPFPERRGDLPIGTRFEASVLLLPAYVQEPLVRRWRLLPEAASAIVALGTDASSVHDMALYHAARDAVNRKAREELRALGRGPALCKFWSSERSSPENACRDKSCTFRHYFVDSKEESRAELLEASKESSRAAAAQERQAYDEVDDQPHGNSKERKSRRAQCFAAWLLSLYGREALSAGGGVLDVAGGQGDLSWALSVEAGVTCTLIDPALRRGGALKSWQRRALRKSGTEAFAHLPVMFDEQHFGARASDGSSTSECHDGVEPPPSYAPFLQSASVVVGLHPDEATEAIVDLALSSGRRFAVVPCCVYAHKFPGRTLTSGLPVRTLNQFCAYLRAKDPRIQEALLDIEGRNKVLYIP
mmetsp:Transcript_143718/g.459919  ORF Transcript_143718/g.459919 Transcript_143718/m.459919 type:complete len:504 (-) Transcript_143718:134-1645(-)